MTPQDAPLFPDETAPRRGRRFAVALLVLAVVVAAALVGTSVASGDEEQRLVTAAAEVTDVASELHGVATLEPVVQAAVAFPADGTVATIDVAVGDTVALGQQLASLDVDDLTDDLHAAEASLAEAELALRRALDGESVDDVGGAVSAPASTDSAGTTAEVVWAVAAQDAGTELASLQRAVLDAQQAVDAALQASEAAMAAADEVCADGGATTTGAAEDGATTTTTVGPSTDDAAVDACRTALEQVRTAQQTTAAAQAQLAAASDALDQYLLTQTGASGSGSGSAGAGGAISGGSGDSTSTSSPSAAELVALQQRVDAAALGVAAAQQAVAQAAVVSPIVGTVVAIGFDVGDDVTAASATQTITVQGDDGMEAVTTVALADVASVAVGQPATVEPDGSDDVVVGEVVAVAAVPDDDATTTSYRVTIGIADGADELGNGTTGSVSIVTDEVRAALAVPPSAVTWSDGRALVQVVADGESSTTTVEVGVVGTEWIEILDGLEEGDLVVLADAAEPLPGSATDTTSSGAGAISGPFAASGGSGGFPTGGPPSGGPPGS